MATSFFYIYIDIYFDIYIDIDIYFDIYINIYITFTNWQGVQSFYWTPFFLLYLELIVWDTCLQWAILLPVYKIQGRIRKVKGGNVSNFIAHSRD